MSRIFTSTILFNKSISGGGAAFMEERRSQSNSSSTETSESSETPSPEIDPKAMFDSYMSEFKEETPQPESKEKSNDNSWSPLKSFHSYLDALEKEPDLNRLVVDGIKELRERVSFTENGEKDYEDCEFSLTAYDISLKATEHQMENVYSSHSNFDILYILLNWMQEAGIQGDCSYNDAYPLTVIQNEDICYIWSIMIFKDGTLKECSIGESRNNKETPINFRSIEDIQIAIANKPFTHYKSKRVTEVKEDDATEIDVNEDKPSAEEVARRVKEVAAILRKNEAAEGASSAFPPLTVEAIKFIDEACVEKGIDANSTSDEVQEIWDALVWDFGLVDDCNSDEERANVAQAFWEKTRLYPKRFSWHKRKTMLNVNSENSALITSKETSSQHPSFPPLTAEAIKFIDSKILEKGGITEIDEKEVEEIWEGLNFDFGLVDKNLSEEEINKWAASIVAYLQHEQSKL